jgi:hypothetical protein
MPVILRTLVFTFYVYIRDSAVSDHSDEYTFITNILHKKRNIPQDIMTDFV